MVRKQVVASFCSTIVQYSKVTGDMVSNISMNGGGEGKGRVGIRGKEGKGKGKVVCRHWDSLYRIDRMD